MTLDTSDVQSALSKIERDMRRLQADVDQLRHAVDAAEEQRTGHAWGSPLGIGLKLPPEIVVRQNDEVTEYLRQFPGTIGLVEDIADSLVKEFQGEPSEIELAVYQDSEIDDRFLVFYVRRPGYDTSHRQRIKTVMNWFSDRRAVSDGWVIATTDHRPLDSTGQGRVGLARLSGVSATSR